GARGGLLELEQLLEQLAWPARAQRGVVPAREVVSEQAERAEAIGNRGARQRREGAEGGDPKALELLGQRRQLWPMAEQRDRLGGEVVRAADHPEPIRIGARRGSHDRAEARRARAEPDPARPGLRARRYPVAQCGVGGAEHSFERAP